MGIRKLNSVLSSHNALLEYKNIFEYRKKHNKKKKMVMGIDFMLYAFKFKISLDNILIGFINQILQLLSNDIIPIYIIDGYADDTKREVINKRNSRRDKITNEIDDIKLQLNNLTDNSEKIILEQKVEKMSKLNKKVDSDDISIIINLFKLLNINYIRAKGEADILLTYLFKNNIIDTCLSEDMDLIVYGCKSMIKISKKTVIEYNLNKILDRLELKYEEFIELCILLGCDYLNSILRCKPSVIYNEYVKFKDKFIENNEFSEEYIAKFYETKNNFINSYKEYKNIDIEITNNKIEYDDLNDFINKNCKTYKNYNLENIIKKINSKII